MKWNVLRIYPRTTKVVERLIFFVVDWIANEINDNEWNNSSCLCNSFCPFYFYLRHFKITLSNPKKRGEIILVLSVPEKVLLGKWTPP